MPNHESIKRCCTLKQTYLIGASYYPEWWPEEEWKRDFEKMASLGLNAVRMGEFAWSWYEPREGEYDFEPMRRAVRLAAEYGIKTIMCTTTAVCPPWLYRKYPEVKGGNDNGIYGFGGRKGNCLSSDIFLDYARKITEEQARVFANDPNVVGWQLDNEPGFPFVCYDPCCEKKFRKWLEQRYGTVEKLNDAWFSMMWSHHYNSFDDFFLPVNAPEGGWSPGMRLDYRRFFSDNFNNLLSEEARIIRSYGSNQFLYTNWPGANWSVSCEDAISYLDYSAWDNYVSLPAGDEYHVQLRSSMEHDFDRRLSNGKQRFLIAEQRANTPADIQPEAVRMQTWLDVAHGAFGNIYFEFRVPTGGQEQNYPSILNADGTFNSCESVIRKLSADIKTVYPLIEGAKTVSPAASVYSYHSSWATPGWVVDGPYDEDFFEAHGGFKNALHQNMDVVFPSDDLSAYRLVVAPNLMILTEQQRTRLEQYVRDGGVLVINPLADTRDEANRIREVRLPALFDGQCGAHAVASVDAGSMARHLNGEPLTVRFDNGNEYNIACNLYELEVDPDAEVLATYTCGRLRGKAAVVAKKIGKGTVVLYASDTRDYRYYEELARVANRYANIEPLLDAPDGLIVSSREKDGQTYIIAVNAKESPVSLNLQKTLYDVLKQKEISGNVCVDGLDVLFARVL